MLFDEINSFQIEAFFGNLINAHSFIGSALALPRIMAALLENNQTPNGIRIPKVLVPYCDFEVID